MVVLWGTECDKRVTINDDKIPFSSVSELCPNSLRPHGLQHARLPCPSPTPRACSNSCPLSWWCHPTISSHLIVKIPKASFNDKLDSLVFCHLSPYLPPATLPFVPWAPPGLKGTSHFLEWRWKRTVAWVPSASPVFTDHWCSLTTGVHWPPGGRGLILHFQRSYTSLSGNVRVSNISKGWTLRLQRTSVRGGWVISSFSLKNVLLIWLRLVLVVAQGISDLCCSVWDLDS